MIKLDELIFRPPNNVKEYEAIIDLQREVWHCDEVELTPLDLLKMHGELGGVVLAAWEPKGSPIGFVYSLLGIKDGKLRHWSRMLAVLPEYRDLGLGRILKFKQREIILSQGISVCRWTFDPLQTKNAYLNIVKLGAVSFEYHPNAYGYARNELDSGLPTDRLIAYWELDSPRVVSAAEGIPQRSGFEPSVQHAAIQYEIDGDIPVVRQVRSDIHEKFIHFPVPADFHAVKSKNMKQAEAWRMALREVFTFQFDRGYVFVDVLPPEHKNNPLVHYVLEKQR